MQTIEQYAAEIAAGDLGQRQVATRRAAVLVGHRPPAIDLSARFPVTQILLRTTALILYGLAVRMSVDPREVSAISVHNWAAERMLPLAPHPDDSMSNAQWTYADRRWRQERDHAVERIRQDLAELLRSAGHAVPDADVRSLDRYSDDPVVMTWIDLADTDPPESPARYGALKQFPVPRLAIGVTALQDLNDDEGDDC